MLGNVFLSKNLPHIHNNCFVTLTFGYEQCLWYLQNVRKFSYYKARRYASFLCWSLEKREYVLFQKRLRRLFGSTRIRFFHCGEYGEKYNRPHHHAIILGFDFPDKYEWFHHGAVKVYRSPTLEKWWSYGLCSIGEVNFDSACYVARYCIKKITGDQADFIYDGIQPEYSTMSNRPGIGASWIEKYGSDVYNYDVLVSKKGFKMRPPAYYDKLYDIKYPSKMEKIKENRIKKLKLKKIDLSRLIDKENVKKIKIKKLVRSYENG